jgi:hypothetical protein
MIDAVGIGTLVCGKDIFGRRRPTGVATISSYRGAVPCARSEEAWCENCLNRLIASSHREGGLGKAFELIETLQQGLAMLARAFGEGNISGPFYHSIPYVTRRTQRVRTSQTCSEVRGESKTDRIGGNRLTVAPMSEFCTSRWVTCKWFHILLGLARAGAHDWPKSTMYTQRGHSATLCFSFKVKILMWRRRIL